MDSRDLRAERAPGALDRNRRLRLLAITLWTAFLGACLTMLAALALLPPAALHGAGWAELSIGFLCAWLLSAVPVTLALMLVLPLRLWRSGGR